MHAPEPEWGQFIFLARDQSDPRVHRVPPRARGISNSESIPTAHAGLREFGKPTEVLAAFPDDEILVPSFVPDGYSLIGCYVVVDQGAVTDFGTSFGRDKEATLFSADLAVGWTGRAPMPLPARDYELAGEPLGRRGAPLRRARVRGYAAVMQEWINPGGLDRSLRIPSSLNSFDDAGRLWAVQADENESVLDRVAESLARPS